MVNWRQISRRRWAAFLVLALALADAAAIYYAHNRLSTPWTEQAGFQDGGEALIAEAEAPRVFVKDVWPAAPAIAVQVMPSRAPNAAMAGNAMDRPDPVPAYRPLRLAVEEEAPAPVPQPGLAVRMSGDGGLRIARLLQSRQSARRFDSAFATDIAGPAASETVMPRSGIAPEAALAGETPQPGAVSGDAASYAPAETNEIASPPDEANAEAPTMVNGGPEPAPQSGAELPAIDADPGADSPPV